MADRTEAQFRAAVEASHKYEDFVMSVLWDNGIACFPHRSQCYQWEHGESRQGIEIKEDRKFRETGNLFVEIEERRTTDGKSRWRHCGIDEEPQPRLYAIGDYQTVYLLPVRPVSDMARRLKFNEPVGNSTNTAFGFLVPVSIATRLAVDVFEVTP